MNKIFKDMAKRHMAKAAAMMMLMLGSMQQSSASPDMLNRTIAGVNNTVSALNGTLTGPDVMNKVINGMGGIVTNKSVGNGICTLPPFLVPPFPAPTCPLDGAPNFMQQSANKVHELLNFVTQKANSLKMFLTPNVNSTLTLNTINDYLIKKPINSFLKSWNGTVDNFKWLLYNKPLEIYKNNIKGAPTYTDAIKNILDRANAHFSIDVLEPMRKFYEGQMLGNGYLGGTKNLIYGIGNQIKVLSEQGFETVKGNPAMTAAIVLAAVGVYLLPKAIKKLERYYQGETKEIDLKEDDFTTNPDGLKTNPNNRFESLPDEPENEGDTTGNIIQNNNNGTSSTILEDNDEDLYTNNKIESDEESDLSEDESDEESDLSEDESDKESYLSEDESGAIPNDFEDTMDKSFVNMNINMEDAGTMTEENKSFRDQSTQTDNNVQSHASQNTNGTNNQEFEYDDEFDEEGGVNPNENEYSDGSYYDSDEEDSDDEDFKDNNEYSGGMYAPDFNQQNDDEGFGSMRSKSASFSSNYYDSDEEDFKDNNEYSDRMYAPGFNQQDDGEVLQKVDEKELTDNEKNLLAMGKALDAPATPVVLDNQHCFQVGDSVMTYSEYENHLRTESLKQNNNASSDVQYTAHGERMLTESEINELTPRRKELLEKSGGIAVWADGQAKVEVEGGVVLSFQQLAD